MMINTVFMAVMSMILTCITAAMAGYALAKKRFVGRKLLFTLIVCAMAHSGSNPPKPSVEMEYPGQVLAVDDAQALKLDHELRHVDSATP